MSDPAADTPPVAPEPDETAVPPAEPDADVTAAEDEVTEVPVEGAEPAGDDVAEEPTAEEVAADVQEPEVIYYVSITREAVTYDANGDADVDKVVKEGYVDPDMFEGEDDLLEALQEKFGEKLAELFDVQPPSVATEPDAVVEVPGAVETGPED